MKVLKSKFDSEFDVTHMDIDEMYPIDKEKKVVIMKFMKKFAKEFPKKGMLFPLIVYPTKNSDNLGARILNKRIPYAVWYGCNRLRYAVYQQYTHVSVVIVQNEKECDAVLAKIFALGKQKEEFKTINDINYIKQTY